MSTVKASNLPAEALLKAYAETEGCFTDCYIVDVSADVSIAGFVAAFYTTPLFKLERILLKLALSRPSTDEEAELLAGGHIDTFSAWNVEQRVQDQLLMSDRMGRTRSWFMVAPLSAGGSQTRLYFGSAVLPIRNEQTGEVEMSSGFKALLGFHKIYARALLSAAERRLTD